VGLLVEWVSRDFRSRYRRSSLRAVWAVLQPVLTVATYAFIFGVIFSQSGGDLPYLSYLLAGMVVYRVVAAALGSITCLVDNADLIGHSHFPREIVPLSRVLGNGPDLVIMTLGLLVVAVVQGVSLQPTLVALPLVLLSVVVLASALCIIGSTVQVFVRDLEFIMTFVLMALFFASPISYQPDQLPSQLQWLNWVNPISVDVQATRDVALSGTWPQPLFYVHMLLAVALFVAAVAHLRSIQHRIVDLG
jgi:ABC-type polysaccharide/polyol phosphate export permease